jgi:hypothetical protein
VKLPEGSRRTPKEKVASFGNLWRFLRKAARGEASYRKPKDALLSGGSRRTPFFQEEAEGSELVSSSPPEVKLLPFLREDARPSASFGKRGT